MELLEGCGAQVEECVEDAVVLDKYRAPHYTVRGMAEKVRNAVRHRRKITEYMRAGVFFTFDMLVVVSSVGAVGEVDVWKDGKGRCLDVPVKKKVVHVELVDNTAKAEVVFTDAFNGKPGDVYPCINGKESGGDSGREVPCAERPREGGEGEHRRRG